MVVVVVVVVKAGRGGVSKELCFVLERASLPSPSLICMKCAPGISEPELEQLFPVLMDNESRRK